MKIKVIRHGLTQSNKEARLMGRGVDETLTQQGIDQAHEVARLLVGSDCDILISSPMKRAQQTAEIINTYLQLPLVVINEFAERDAGNLGGKLWTDIAVETQGVLTLEKIHASPEHDFSLWGGESADSLRKRVMSAADALKEKYTDQKVLVVTHGGVIKVMYAIYGGEFPDHVGNASIHEFEI
jgi:broad specificity phosphatase PhoE